MSVIGVLLISTEQLYLSKIFSDFRQVSHPDAQLIGRHSDFVESICEQNCSGKHDKRASHVWLQLIICTGECFDPIMKTVLKGAIPQLFYEFFVFDYVLVFIWERKETYKFYFIMVFLILQQSHPEAKGWCLSFVLLTMVQVLSRSYNVPRF